MPLADGAVFAGYTIVRLLGAGGMGEVYLVDHPRLPRREALKILSASVSADPNYRQRFAREADIAASLWHPHVVQVHDRGEHDGQLWITMDYVEGTDAAQELRDRYPHGMPIKNGLAIVSAIADALDYSHERHLLHRDVKPANILLTNPRMGDRRVLLADFGIARAANDINGLTQTNIRVGSVGYCAPEQLAGKELDGRADQYALASTAFHLLTGAPPFANANSVDAPPPRLGSLRADLSPLDDVMARAMAKEPYQRFDTCRGFAAALTHAVAGDETQFATNIPPPFPHGTNREQASSSGSDAASRWRRAALIAGGIATLLAVGVVAFVGARLAQPPSAPPTASPPQPSSTRQESPKPQSTYTEPPAPPLPTGPPPTPPPATTAPPAPPAPDRPAGDLGLRTPISNPPCNGQAIVILGNITTPGLYAAGVQQLLDAHPGAYYLRTDQSCPSLRRANDAGNPIYAVFEPTTPSKVCDAVHRAGGSAYGKFLDYTHDPGFIIPCG